MSQVLSGCAVRATIQQEQKDYIGPDPVAWVERLIEVAERSQFTDAQKQIIDKRLRQLHLELRL